MYTSQRATAWHFSFRFRWPNLPCLPERESRVRDIVTHCRPVLWPKRLRNYLGCTVQQLFCLDQQLEDRDLFLYPFTKKTLSNLSYDYDLWKHLVCLKIISNMYSKRTSTLRLVSAANWRIFRSLSAVTRFPFAPVFTCTRTFTKRVNIMKHMI